MNFTKRHEPKFAEMPLQRQASSRPNERRDSSLIAFAHIPKTAGTSVKTMFVRAYSRAEIHDAGNVLKAGANPAGKVGSPRVLNARVTIGHAPYGVLRQYLPEDTRYVTFLREPVERVLSHYYRHVHRPHLGRTGRKERREAGRATAGSLEEALVEMRLPHISNLATRLLCSDPSPMGELRPSALDEAKANLRQFAFVGVTERSDESIALLQRVLGLGLVPYGEHRRVTGKRPDVEEITDAQRALIEEANGLDSELYALAKQLFEDAAEAAGEQLVADVEELRMLNEAAIEGDQAALEDACDWLEREMPPGTTRPAAEMRAAAQAAGISELAFPRAYKRVGVRREVDEEARQRVLTRPRQSKRKARSAT